MRSREDRETEIIGYRVPPRELVIECLVYEARSRRKSFYSNRDPLGVTDFVTELPHSLGISYLVNVALARYSFLLTIGVSHRARTRSGITAT